MFLNQKKMMMIRVLWIALVLATTATVCAISRTENVKIPIRQQPKPLPLHAVPKGHADRKVHLSAHDLAALLKNEKGLRPHPKIRRFVTLHGHTNGKPTNPRRDHPNCMWNRAGKWNLKRSLFKGHYDTHGMDSDAIRALPWKFNPIGSRLTSAEVERSLTNAFHVWDRATSGIDGSVFEESDGRPSSFVTHSRNGFNEIAFGKLRSSHSNFAFLYELDLWKNTETDEILEVDIMFNADLDWAYYTLEQHGDHDAWMNANPNRICLFALAVNAFGHALGLGTVSHPDHSMFGLSGFSELKKGDLHCGDLTGITELYSS